MEAPYQEDVDLSDIEYDASRNLTVIKGTDIPAVNFDQQGTGTRTKTFGEGSDADMSGKFSNILMATATHTRVHNEGPDEDPRRKLSLLMGTSTKTFTKTESSDSDREPAHSRFVRKMSKSKI